MHRSPTFSTLLQHWMGPVEQLGSPPRTARGVAAARSGRAAAVKTATRENIIVLECEWCKESGESRKLADGEEVRELID